MRESTMVKAIAMATAVFLLAFLVRGVLLSEPGAEFVPTSYVYIMSNESMPGMVKIGYSDNPVRRAQDLYTTGVPTPFLLEHYVGVEYPIEVESEIHDKLAKYRVNDRREFFEISVEEAEKVLDRYGTKG